MAKNLPCTKIMEEYDTESSQGFSQHTNTQQDSRESNVDELLSSFNKGYHQAKAQQIIRLLNDQDCLNTRFKERDLRESSDSGESDSDGSLSETSVKEAEKRLNQKLALHKQIGGRSKTSMGFYNEIEYDEHSESLKTNGSKMAERESEFDTRYNRPKSSYVRRRGLYMRKDESTIENTEIMDDITETSSVKRISKSARPRSSYGTRNTEGCKRKIAHSEANFNQDTEGPVYPTEEDLVSSNDYDRYASTKTNPVPQLRRERTRISGFCDEGQQIREQSTPLSSLDTRDSVIVTELTPMKMKAMDTSPHQVKYTNSPELLTFPARNHEPIPSRPVSRRSGERVIPHPDHTDPRTMRQTGSERPRTRRLQRRHMAQQNINNSPSSRPTSESVILARQRTEYNLERAKGSARPKSEKMLISSTNKSLISVDSAPMQGPATSVTKTKSGESQSSHVQTTGFRGFGAAARQIPSNAGTRRSELSLPRPGNNVILGGRRPLTLMKLPPLDMVAKKTDKNLQLAHETCV